MKRFIRGLHNLKPQGRGCVATIGSFDGVHLGHCEIIAQLREQADLCKLPAVAIFFEPQPSEFFSGELSPPRLMRLHEKVEALFNEGVDTVCCLAFNRKLRALSAEAFIRRVLVDGLGVKSLVVGDDFRFGLDRSGDYSLLQKVGKRAGFKVLANRTVTHRGERVSSTRIRQALQSGEFGLAETLLGRPFTVRGKVARGQRLGTRLGVPTANLVLHRYAVPISGVYVVEVTLPGGTRAQGVANMGVRPTVENRAKPILEVHLLDFNQDIYGQRITVRPIKKIRDEKKFASLEQLVGAMQQDIKFTRVYFSNPHAYEPV